MCSETSDVMEIQHFLSLYLQRCIEIIFNLFSGFLLKITVHNFAQITLNNNNSKAQFVIFSA